MKKKVCIVGLGYVGLPLAFLCIEKGYIVVGLDINKDIVNDINKGKMPIYDFKTNKNFKEYQKKINATLDPKVLRESDIVVVCVPTPVDENHNPDLSALTSAVETISKYLKKGHLVIIESTVYPGVTEEIVQPILEKSKLKAGKDFFLSYCPERIDPGNQNWGIKDIPRVFGSISPEGARQTKEFYESIVSSEIIQNSSIKIAEAVKVVENTFRDVNIALVNELAKAFDLMNIDVVEVINSASTKPYAFMPHYPGCGVGGHCIPVDPYYLIERVKKEGFDHNFLSLARSINNSMPEYTVNKVIEGLNEINKSVKDTRITILGLAYKKDIDDIRNSPAFKIIEQLEKKGAVVTVYDPFVKEKSIAKNLNEALDKSECIVITTNHSEFIKLNAEKLKEKEIKVVIDGRNCLNKKEIEKLGIIYKGIGR